MSQVLTSPRSAETKRSPTQDGIGHFNLDAIKQKALRGRPSVRLRFDKTVMVCGCFQCTYEGDIDTPQTVKLARKDNGKTVLLHSACSLEVGMELLRLPLDELVQELQTVPGISGVSGNNKPR